MDRRNEAVGMNVNINTVDDSMQLTCKLAVLIHSVSCDRGAGRSTHLAVRSGVSQLIGRPCKEGCHYPD